MFADTSFGLLLFLSPSLPSLKKVIEEFELRLVVGGRSSQLIKAVDTKFRKQIQELHIRYNKVYKLHDINSYNMILVILSHCFSWWNVQRFFPFWI